MKIEIDEHGHIIHYQYRSKDFSFTNMEDCMEYAKLRTQRPTVRQFVMITGFPKFVNWEKTKENPLNPIFYTSKEIFEAWQTANENRFKKEKAE